MLRAAYNLLFAFIVTIDEIQNQIQHNNAKVDAVKNQYVAFVSANHLARNARDIPDDNCDNENYALTLCGLRFYALINGNRPRQTETNKHNQFKNFFHKNLSLHFSIFTIIHLTKINVKYIIIIKLISFAYQLNGECYGITEITVFLHSSEA